MLGPGVSSITNAVTMKETSKPKSTSRCLGKLLVGRSCDRGAGYRVHPAQVIVDLLDARDISCGDHGRVALPVVGDDAVEVGDAFSDHDVQAHRAPRLLVHRLQDFLAQRV